MQLGKHKHHDAKQQPIVCQGQRSMSEHHILKRCRQDRDKTVSFRIIQLGTLDHLDGREKTFCFYGQSSKSYHLIGKSCRLG
jgi:hypothetical protein